MGEKAASTASGESGSVVAVSLFFSFLVHAPSKARMAQSATPVLPTGLYARPIVTRSNSITSTSSSQSGVSLRRRSRTRTRSNTTSRRGKSVGPRESGRDSGDDTLPPLPPLVPGEYEGRSSLSNSDVPTRSSHTTKAGGSERRPTPGVDGEGATGRTRAQSHVHIRDVFAEAVRGRHTRSEGGSLRAVCLKVQGLFTDALIDMYTGQDVKASLPKSTKTHIPCQCFLRRVFSSAKSRYPFRSFRI